MGGEEKSLTNERRAEARFPTLAGRSLYPFLSMTMQFLSTKHDGK